MGNVFPSLVEREILTAEQEIGDKFVPATFQLTVTLEPAAIVVALLGAVTAKGPALLTEVTVVEA
jgi:hypothetical protein